MKCALLLVGWLAAASASAAMEPAELKRLLGEIGKWQFAPVERFLAENRAAMGRDPEYFVVLLNFVLSKGERSGVVVARGSPGEGDYGLSQNGKPVGFLGPGKTYDEALILDGIARVRAALPSFRARLDIHLGLLAAAERIRRWDVVGEQCVAILKLSREIDNHWTWGATGSMGADPRKFMLDNIQGRAEMLFQQEDAKADQAFLDISNALVNGYPELIYGYNDLGTMFLLRKDFANAEKFLRQAERIDRHDEVVQRNLAKLEQMLRTMRCWPGWGSPR